VSAAVERGQIDQENVVTAMGQVGVEAVQGVQGQSGDSGVVPLFCEQGTDVFRSGVEGVDEGLGDVPRGGGAAHG
jgi:hypothetical protein